jgi:glycosyltransferase involved in cell wall biosynthesis
VPAESAKPPWFLVSKPLRPPFRDGSTVLVRGLVEHMPPERRVVHLGDPSQPLRSDVEVISAPAMGYSPGFAAKARVLGAMISPSRRKWPLHLFFTPNGLTSRVLLTLRGMQSHRPMVQSLMSAHEVEGWVKWLRPLDMVVVLSEQTRGRLIGAGMPEAKVRRIYPGVAAAQADGPAVVAERWRILYAGDLDATVAERLIRIGQALSAMGWRMTIACRPKGDGDAAARAKLQAMLAPQLADGTVTLLAEVEDMTALMRRCSLQIFVADHVKRKVDLPLVLLEGLARGLPVLSLGGTPVPEIFAVARGRKVEAGTEVADVGELLGALGAAQRWLARWSAGAAKVAQEFSLPMMVAQYTALYDELEARSAGER